MRRSLHFYAVIMSKNKGKKTQKIQKETSNNDPVYTDKQGNICLRILAKPGAKQNSISNLDNEGIHVQIAAPPPEGEANTELIKFLSSVLNLRKSDVSLEKGSRSRNKIVMIDKSVATIEAIRETLLNNKDD